MIDLSVSPQRSMMDSVSKMFLFFSLGCMTGMVTEGQKSQYLVLSESRKTGLEGTLLQVNCTAQIMSPVDSLKWIPGHEGQTDIQQVYLTNTTVVMTISSLDGSDAGRYKCLLVMKDGREETAEFELMVRRKEPSTATCSITQFKCRKTKHCIFLRYRCDGKDDCGDGSDEDCESNPCLNKFRCNNSRCVDNQDVCNHVDNCGDRSDEAPSCILDKSLSTTTQAILEDNQFGWLKITMSTVIASTVGVVILISFIIIVVFRVKMRRLRERRTARAHGGIYHHGEPQETTSSGHGDEASDQRPFLPPGSHHFGNIIVNVNNGVQYLPGYDYSLFVAVPPPYSECGASNNNSSGNKPQPPPYSTIDRNSAHQQQQASVSSSTDVQTARPNISVSSVQNCLGVLKGPNFHGPAGHGNNEPIGFPTSGGPLVRAHNSEFEGLSGITSTFLQSLLGSHREGVPVAGGAKNSGQNLNDERLGGMSCSNQLVKTPDSTAENPNMVLSSSHCQPVHVTVCNSTQTTPQSVTFNNVNLTAEENMQDRKESEHLTQPNEVSASSLCDSQQNPATFVVEQQGLVCTHNSNQQTTLNFTGIKDVCSPSNSAALRAAHDNDQANSAAFRYAHDDDDQVNASQSLSLDDSAGLLDERLVDCDTHMTDEHTNILQPLLSSQSDAIGIHVDNNEIPCYSDIIRPKLVPLSVRDEKLALKDSTYHKVYANDHNLDNQPHNATNNVSTNLGLSINMNTIDSSAESISVQSSNKQSPYPNTDLAVNTSDTGKQNRFSGELNVRDGCLILESPKHTPSSQILSHLQGAYAAEQLANVNPYDEPVGNTKRPAGVVARPALPKFQSDFVLRNRNQPL